MDWACTLKVYSVRVWAAWKVYCMGKRFTTLDLSNAHPTEPLYIPGGTAMLIGAVFVEYRRRRSALISRMVPDVLARLRDQARAYRVDAKTTRHPYVVSARLRDDLLQDEHSVTARTRIWRSVARIVEANANVRTNLEETEDGDEALVWRWMGAV